MRAAIGPAMPIATAMLPVASHITHPIPDPALALNRTAIASERNDGLSSGLCSILFALPMCLRRRTWYYGAQARHNQGNRPVTAGLRPSVAALETAVKHPDPRRGAADF